MMLLLGGQPFFALDYKEPEHKAKGEKGGREGEIGHNYMCCVLL